MNIKIFKLLFFYKHPKNLCPLAVYLLWLITTICNSHPTVFSTFVKDTKIFKLKFNIIVLLLVQGVHYEMTKK